MREQHGFSEFALHALAKEANCTWIAEHIDATMAQTLATRAYQAVNRVCLGKAKKGRFRKHAKRRLVREIIHIGNEIRIEKISYKGWQKQFGKSVGFRAPGMLIDRLRRTVASTGGTLTEFPTRPTKLSQYCHGCGKYVKKPLSQRWHRCTCGVGPVQRDLYADITPSSAQYHLYWESAEPRLQAALERLIQRGV